MKYLLILIAIATVSIVSECAAQVTPVEIVAAMLFYTENSLETPVELRFGFGSKYTDSADYGLGEFLVPGPPPQSFYVVHTDQDIGQNCMKDRSNWDIRGVPDSVASGSVRQFSLTYEYEMWRYIGQLISCHLSWGIQRGIDSVCVTDFYLSHIFSHTFINNNQVADTASIPNGLGLIKMTAYYNIDHLRSAVRDAMNYSGTEIRVVPNVVRVGERSRILGAIQPNMRAMLVDVSGKVVADFRRVASEGITMPAVATGMYELVLMTPDGRLVRSMAVAIIE